jgi:hypothetical protein
MSCPNAMGCRAAVRQRDLQRIMRLECNGTMGRRRRELHEWFEANLRATPAEAVRALGYSYPDYMYAVADSVKVDLLRGDLASLEGTGAGRDLSH